MSTQPKRIYEFGPFRVDSLKRILLRDGEIVPLKPKVFETLLVLLEAHGQVLEKDELIKRLWPDSIVEESNLNVYVSLLRKALGESPNDRHYIVTIPGRGYSFVAEVRELQGESAKLIVDQRTRSSVIIEEDEKLSHQNEVPTETETGSTFRQNKIIDLKSFKQEPAFEGNGEQDTSPEVPSAQTAVEVIKRPAASAEGEETTGAAAGVKSFISQITRHERVAILVLAALIVMVATAFFFYVNHKPILTETDRVMLADFVNTTGDAVFDGTLKLALAVKLEESPFLQIFPDQQVQESLRLMKRSPDERITRELAREICERQGIKALLVGSIVPLGSHYVIALEAINANTGDVIARQQLEAEGKEQVLPTLGRMTTKLREKLGESLPSIQKFDAPILQATTSSLEAFKAYSNGMAQFSRGKWLEAIPFYERATELDTNFAMAIAMLSRTYSSIGNNDKQELSEELARKAFALRDRLSERERLFLSQRYYYTAERNLDKALETLETWKQTYPKDLTPHNNLAGEYTNRGQYEKALEEAREAHRLYPTALNPYAGLADAFIRLNRFDEAEEIIKQAFAQKLERFPMHGFLYQVAFVREDATMMRQQIDWASKNGYEHYALNWQASGAAFLGQARKSRELANRAMAVAQRRKEEEWASQFAAQAAQRDATFGHCQQTREESSQALALSHDQAAMIWAASAVAMCGKASQAQSLIDELLKRYPRNVYVSDGWSPIIRAEIEIQRGHPSQVLQLLQSNKFAAGTAFTFSYLRGQAYLLEQAGAEAAAEFQKILDHRGWDILSPLYPLAHLGLARAMALTGDIAKSRKAYEDFLALWKDADPDLPILQAAKKEYEKLK